MGMYIHFIFVENLVIFLYSSSTTYIYFSFAYLYVANISSLLLTDYIFAFSFVAL